MKMIGCRRCKTTYADFRNQCPTCGMQKPVKLAPFERVSKHDRYCTSCDGPVNADTRCDCCDEPTHKKCLSQHERRVIEMEYREMMEDFA